ncbi:MAG: Maf family nucleotide pyrophosphatase [Saprospiraceae bacterium]
MKSILKGRRLILGSKSPRRGQLLKELDIPFIQKSTDADESFPAELPVKEVAAYIAKNKAAALFERIKEDDIILTADTIVVCNGNIYGKPKNKKESKEYLEALMDNVHQVITGVCLMDANNHVCFSETSEVKILPLRNKEFTYYIDKYLPIDKAGAYGIQEWLGHAKIEWIKGTYTNIMGLPTRKVYEELIRFC